MSEQDQTLYDFLGLPRTATQEQIVAAFRAKAAAMSPDTVGTEESSKNLQLLGQAYRILTVPDRRREYDATLPPVSQVSSAFFDAMPQDWMKEATPPAKSGETDDEDETGLSDDPLQRQVQKVWKKVFKRFEENNKRYSPALEGMRAIVPLTLEKEKTVVLGHDPAQANHIAYVDTVEYLNFFRRTFGELLGKPVEIRLIPVTTLEEWYTIRDAEERVRQRQSMRAQLPRPTGAAAPAEHHAGHVAVTAGNWDEVMTSIESWVADDSATLQSRAQFILQHIMLIEQTEDRARNAGEPLASLQQSVHHALSRLAKITGTDPVLIGLEFVRYKMK